MSLDDTDNVPMSFDEFVKSVKKVLEDCPELGTLIILFWLSKED